MIILLHHTACPKCREEGADRTGNNLAVYSDGHTYCYRCGWYTSENKVQAYKNRNIEQEHKQLVLPYDAEPSIPEFAREWLINKYEFNNNTLISNRILWSESREYLIFPYYINEQLLGWQGRVFNAEEKKKRKWFSQGQLDSFIYLRGKDSPCLILTESIISAIKVSRYNQACPIFGSNISSRRWAQLATIADRVIIWYDPDKHKEALEQAQQGRLYIPNVSTIRTEKKPKDYSYDEIYQRINQAT